jgi:hypothetical protein
MKRLATFVSAICLVFVFDVGASAQNIVDTEDPRQLSLDVYSGINRAAPPATVAVRLQTLVRIFRYRCTRLTDYQVFTQRTNIIDLKVKCSGDPLYGVTVASNGYVSVYGGNGILSGLNRSDALIYSFGSDGDLAGDSSLTVNQALGETVERLDLEDEVNVVYVLGVATLTLAFLFVFSLVWWRAWKHKATRKPRQRMKPMQKHRVGASSSVKNQVMEESTEIITNVYKHPDGFYIARGKRGKRRFFSGAVWAKLYAARGWRLFEISAPDGVGSPTEG